MTKKKSANRNMVGHGKLALLTALLAFGIGKTALAQNTGAPEQEIPVGPAKTSLSTSDSICVIQICSGEAYEDIVRLESVRNKYIAVYDKCNAAVNSYVEEANGEYKSEDLQEMKKIMAIGDQAEKGINKVDSTISVRLREYFKIFVHDISLLKIMPALDAEGGIIIEGDFITVDGDRYAISPSSVSREMQFRCY